jgi:hypothetical protein
MQHTFRQVTEITYASEIVPANWTILTQQMQLQSKKRENYAKTAFLPTAFQGHAIVCNPNPDQNCNWLAQFRLESDS